MLRISNSAAMDSPVASLPLIAPLPGFICGTLPVPTAAEGHSKELVTVQASSMKVISDSSASLRYSFLPAEMDLNDLPANWLKREELVLLDPHLLADKETADTDLDDLCSSCSSRSLAQPLPKKCEDLAVNGLAAYGDEIDFIAPANVMKQIFKTPYSKAPLSVAVHRIGKTLILNDGPDVLESKTKQTSQTMTVNKDLFYKFVHHSVNSAPPPVDSDAETDKPAPQENPCRAWQFYNGGRAQASEPYVETVESPVCPGSPQGTDFQEGSDGDSTWQQNEKGARAGKRRGFGRKRTAKSGRALGKRGMTSQTVGVTSERDISGGTKAVSEEELTSSEADEGAGVRSPKEAGRERFLRVLFWKFQQLQMLLGSDLLLFGNDQHAAVSLHLMEVERQMSPLTWLDAWLDNMMANVPELAVCYHKQGVVQGYELLKTEDLFLLKGMGADGTISFHPQVVHANAAEVLQFLQENCTSEPGAYWLVKNAGEDLMQLFDLSTISDESDASEESEDEAAPSPGSSKPRGPESYRQALALLIYRLALQLARSKAGSDQQRSGDLLMQCLELIEDKNVPDLLAAAHERVAKLCLQQAIQPPLVSPQLLLEAPPSTSEVAVKCLPGPETSRKESGGKEELSLVACSLPDESSGGVHANEKGLQKTREQEEDAGIARLSDESAGTPERSGGGAEEGCGSAAQQEPGGRATAVIASSETRRQSPKESLVIQGTNRESGGESGQAGQEVGQEVGRRTTVDFCSSQPAASTSSEAPEEAIHRHLAAVHHFSQAIKALREELTMLSSKKPGKKKRSAKGASEPGTTAGGGAEKETSCNCKGSRHEARVARTEAKMRKLMGYLMGAYLELGRAYEGDGQLARALKAAEVASVIGGCVQVEKKVECQEIGAAAEPKQIEGHEQGNNHNSSHQESGGPLQEESGSIDKGNGTVELRQSGGNSMQAKARKSRRRVRGEGHIASSLTPDTSRPLKAARPGFWGSLWTFVGDLYVKLQQSWTEEDLLAQQAALLSGAPRLAEGVTEELERFRRGLEFSERERCVGRAEGCRCRGCSSGHASTSGMAGTSGMPGGMGGTKGREAAKTGGRSAKQATDGGGDADLLCFGRPLTLDYDVNLTVAAESYSAAIAALETEGGAKAGGKWELAHRRLGWTCNELGRRRLEEGDISAAEGLFTRALSSFGAVKDTANAVLVHCNMGHARRGQAEAMAADAVKQDRTVAGDRLKQVRIAHTSRCYQQALSHYISARSELLSLGEAEAQQSLRGLWTEVHTQLGHTYLRFGMFLSSNGGGQDNDVSKPVALGRETAVTTRKERARGPERETVPSELLTKALHLYESLGRARAQEAAYSHCQLAAHFRDRCLQLRPSQEVPPETPQGAGKRNEDARWKRLAALAEFHWQKALELYRASSHPDMYVRISIERSMLALKCAAKSRPNHVWDATLSTLAGVPEVFEPPVTPAGDEANGCANEPPSKQTLADLKKHLEWVARELLQAHVNFLKHRSHSEDSVVFATNEKVSKLKTLYKELLQAEDNRAVLKVLKNLLDERIA